MMPTICIHFAGEQAARDTLPIVLAGKHETIEVSGYPPVLEYVERLLSSRGWMWQRATEDDRAYLVAWRTGPREALTVHLDLRTVDLGSLVTNALHDRRYDMFRFVGPSPVVREACGYVPQYRYRSLLLPYDCFEEGWKQLCVTRETVARSGVVLRS
jgi:hypothetical protein